MIEPIDTRPKNVRELNARSATFILLAYVATQICLGAIIVMGICIWAMSQGLDPLRHLSLVNHKLTPATMLLGPVVGGIVVIFLTRKRLAGHAADVGPCGGAWVLGQRSAILQGLLVGLIIAICVHLLQRMTKTHMPFRGLSESNKMAFGSVLPRMAWAGAAVFLAPPLEELLFRGILYGGYRKSFGPLFAALFTSVLFVVMHAPESFKYLLTTLDLLLLAFAALWFRLRARAVGPAIALHAGHNIMVVLTFFTSRFW